MKLSHFFIVPLWTLLFIPLGSCQNNTAYYNYQSLSKNEWSKTDTLQFFLPDTLNAGEYNLEIGVRHTGKYPYRDLWLELTQYVLDEQSQTNSWIEQTDTFHLYLADEKGKWLGNGTTSSFFQFLSPCGTLTLPDSKNAENMTEKSSITEETEKEPAIPQEEQKNGKKKYTFLGTEKIVGSESKLKIQIVHIMQDSILPHIADIGIRLSPNKP